MAVPRTDHQVRATLVLVLASHPHTTVVGDELRHCLERSRRKGGAVADSVLSTSTATASSCIPEVALLPLVLQWLPGSTLLLSYLLLS